jgi:hypothetical protein
MTELRAKCIEQGARAKELNLSLRGGAEAISKNEKGIALVMVLVLSAIILVIMAGLIYMLTTGTQLSGMQKRYKTALEAGIGGADITYQIIGKRMDNPVQLGTEFNFLSAFGVTTSQACLNDKLLKSTANWTSCSSDSTSLTINPANINTYDMSFDLGVGPTYTVYSKIVDTVLGNSGRDEGLIDPSFPPSPESVEKKPYLYTIEVDAQNQSNPAERAKLSILYQY